MVGNFSNELLIDFEPEENYFGYRYLSLTFNILIWKPTILRVSGVKH